MSIVRNCIMILFVTGAMALSTTAFGEIEGKIEIDGSSTVYPISEAAAEKFRKSYPNVDVTVALSGTGGGFKRFTKGETDISDASRPIKDEEFKLCRENKVHFIEIPVAYDGLSIVINPNNKFVTSLSVDQLKKIFLAENSARTWKDVNPAWPAEIIKIYAPEKTLERSITSLGMWSRKKAGHHAVRASRLAKTITLWSTELPTKRMPSGFLAVPTTSRTRTS